MLWPRCTATWTISESRTAAATATGFYIWTDESFISGENAAQKTLDRMGASKAR